MACKYTYNGVEYSKEQLVSKLSTENSNFNTLYNNLVNEITNTETGRKVLDRVKRDYQYKKEIPYMSSITKDATLYYDKNTKTGYIHDNGNPNERKTFNSEEEVRDYLNLNGKYTLEEQQEEAIVELVSLMVADKLNKKTDKNLISLLKQLLQQIDDFIRSLLNQKELRVEDIKEDNLDYLVDKKLKELIKNGTLRKEC